MGIKMLKKKKEKVLEIFDLAASAKEYNEKIFIGIPTSPLTERL